MTDLAHFAIELQLFSTISVLEVTQIFLHYASILAILTKPPILSYYHTATFYDFVITKAIKEAYGQRNWLSEEKPEHTIYCAATAHLPPPTFSEREELSPVYHGELRAECVRRNSYCT